MPVTVEEPPPEAAELFGDAWAQVQDFAAMLTAEGELRGLIGPRELPRLWSRHVLNSSAVAGFIPAGVRFADVGSGAGFPGIVTALMRPDLDVHLIEPMDRRTTWLSDVVRELAIANVTVVRARAEELHGAARFDVVGARAVAALRKLVPWVAPLVTPMGSVIALKGERASAEVEDARKVMRKYGLVDVRVHEVTVAGTEEPTRIVEAVKKG